MKKQIVLLPLLLIVFACAKKERKMELYNTMAFAFTLESGYELNVSSQVKGYQLFEEKSKYYSKLTFTIDIKKPDGSVVTKIQSGKIEQLAKEEDAFTQLNTQIKFDDKYKPGSYSLVINMKDELSGKMVKIEKPFELSK